MKENVFFTGIMPALITPVDENGQLKKEALKKLIEWQLSHGVSGFYICGSTGEGLLLRPEQRMEMLEATLEIVNGRVPVIDHIGDMSLESTIKLAIHAEKCGAAAVSSIPPVYFAYSDNDVYNYYKAITDACSLPMIIYNYPGARAMSVPLLSKILSIDNVIGMKWTSPDFYSMERLKNANKGINVINGPDEMLSAGLSMGADAGIGTTYNLMPGLFVKLYQSQRAGEVAKAKALQIGINNVIEQLLKYNVIASTKAALEFLGFDVGECVKPIQHLSDEEKSALKEALSGLVDFEKQEVIG